MAENTKENQIAQQNETQQKQAAAQTQQKQAENPQQTQDTSALQKGALNIAQQKTPAHQPAQKEPSLLMQLKAQKDSLLEEAKALNSKLSALRMQLAPLAAELKKTKGSNSSRLRSQIDEIEFKIATEAFTAKQEKELIKSKKGLEEQLKSASAADSFYKKASELRAQLKPLSARRDEIDTLLDSLRSQMSAEYEKTKKEREKKSYESLKARYGKKDERPFLKDSGKSAPHFARRDSSSRKPQHDKLDSDEAKYLKKHDDFVSLEDIVIMEKKEKKEEKAAQEGSA